MRNKLSVKLSALIMLVLVLCLGAVSLVYILNTKSMYIQQETKKMKAFSNQIASLNLSSGRETIDDFCEKNDGQDYYLVISDKNFKIIYYSSRYAMARFYLYKDKNIVSSVNVSSDPHYYEGQHSQYISMQNKIIKNGKTYFIYIEESLKTTDSIFSFTNKNLIILTALFVVVSGLAMFVLIKNTTKPIEQLSEVAQNIAASDYTKRYEGKIPCDEIGILAKQLNNMADTIQTNINNLNNLNYLLKSDVVRMNEYEIMRKRFMTNITHELKTPLAIISSQIEMMSYAKDNERRKYYYDSAIDEIGKMNRLISTLLDVSVSERDMFRQKAEKIDLSAFIDNLCVKSRPLVNYNKITLRSDIEQGCILNFAPENVEHVFNNYLMNAIQHTAKGRTISVSLKKHENNFRLTVFNEGEPIDKDSLDKIWTDFYSKFDGEKPTDSRIGIGLFIVKEISVINKTQCGVRNADGGVEFWFDFCSQEG